LRRLLRDEVGFRPGIDNLLLTGDIVTKGPDSLGLIDEVMRLGACSVRGNNDDAAIAAAAEAAEEEQHQEQQEQEHKEQQQKHREKKGHNAFSQSPAFIPGLDGKRLAWLSARPFTVHLAPYNVTVVHAGLVPGVARRKQRLVDLTRMRELLPSPRKKKSGRWRAVETHQPGSVAWAPLWRGPGHIFFGHDSAMGLQRQRACTGLDTGCVYGGRLTCAVLPSLEDLEEARRRSGRWWRRWLGGCFGVDPLPPPLLPRTPRLVRDLRGQLMSVPSSQAGGGGR
jgi:hypothetical protein